MKIPRNRNMTNMKIKMYLELSGITTSCLSATQELTLLRVELRDFFLADLKKNPFISRINVAMFHKGIRDFALRRYCQNPSVQFKNLF